MRAWMEPQIYFDLEWVHSLLTHSNWFLQWCPCISQWEDESSWWGQTIQKRVLSGGSKRELLGLCPREVQGSCEVRRSSLLCGCRMEWGRSPSCNIWLWASGSCRTDLYMIPPQHHSPTRPRMGRLAAGWAAEWSPPCSGQLRRIASDTRGGCFCCVSLRQTAFFQTWSTVAVRWWLQCAGAWEYPGEFIPTGGVIHPVTQSCQPMRLRVLCGVKSLSVFDLHNLPLSANVCSSCTKMYRCQIINWLWDKFSVLWRDYNI